MNKLARSFAISCAIVFCSLTSAPTNASDAISSAIQQRMEELQFGGDLEIDGAEILARELLPDLYAARGFQALWTQPGRLDSLAELLQSALAHGLDPEDYVLDHLQTARKQAANGTSLDQADLDILATEAFIRFGYHQRFGKINPQNLDANINFRRELLEDEDPIVSIQELVEADRPLLELVAEYFPRGAYYRGAQQILAAYREIGERMGRTEEASRALLKRAMTGLSLILTRQQRAGPGDD